MNLWRYFYDWAEPLLYNEFAWTYDWVSWWVSLGRWDAWRRQVLDYISADLTGKQRILEIGFGTGELLATLARRGERIYGLDASPMMQRVTAHKVQGLAAPRVRGFTQAMPFASGSFDLLVATFPARYITAPATLHEAARVLRPGGRWIITGLYFEADRPLWRRFLGLTFGGAPPQQIARYFRRVESYGFHVAIMERPPAAVRVPVLILERRGDVPVGQSHLDFLPPPLPLPHTECGGGG